MTAPDRLRFSPAPTGTLHLGGARTALFDHLVARGTGGTLVLRLEDTDVERSDAVFEEGILRDLAWLGIEWQEGPDVGGAFAPYRQSERSDIYAAAMDRLIASGAVYRCFCEESLLAEQRVTDAAEGRAPRYRGTCRAMRPEGSDRLAADGRPYCWRFRVDSGREVVVRDEVHGEVHFPGDAIGDFLVTRTGGAVLYDLACVVDDAAMGITLVVRGDDHLPNTPRQLLLFEALGHEPPRYAHVPLVAGPDGRPLSKSRGSESVASLREEGYLPAAVVNHLALLGWSDPSGREVLGLDELTSAFDIGRVSASSPSHDPARLRWLNGRHMALLEHEARAALIGRHLPDLPAIGRVEAASLLASEVEVAGDVARLTAPVLSPDEPDSEAMGALAGPVAREALTIAMDALADGPDAVRPALRDAGVSARDALPAIRAALTGRAHGLPVTTVVRLMGIDEAKRRLSAAAGA